MIKFTKFEDLHWTEQLQEIYKSNTQNIKNGR